MLHWCWEHSRWTVPMAFAAVYGAGLAFLPTTTQEFGLTLVGLVGGWGMWPHVGRETLLASPISDYLPDSLCLVVAMGLLLMPAVVWTCQHLA